MRESSVFNFYFVLGLGEMGETGNTHKIEKIQRGDGEGNRRQLQATGRTHISIQGKCFIFSESVKVGTSKQVCEVI